jgi:cytochrome c oxidase cbb3-type subunit 3
MLDHDYDGIKELDNRVPPWFSYLFYITILFAVYYLIDYHVLGTSLLQEEEYALEVKEADALRAELIKTGAFINEETVTLLTDEAAISSGKAIYTANCIACHRNDGGGLIGPNLTDNFWIHGGAVKDVFKTIKYGVPAKGMISWQTQLNPKQMQEVMSFIFTLQGTTPENPKAPEGNKYAPSDTTKTVALK